jgi:hypothetical protein
MVLLPTDYTEQDAGPNGNLFLFRTDAHATLPMDGDYDMLVTVTGKALPGKNQ